MRLEGVLVAVELIEDASLGVAFDCMAGIHQRPGLCFLDEGNGFTREGVKDLAAPILQIKSDNKSKHRAPPSAEFGVSLPGRTQLIQHSLCDPVHRVWVRGPRLSGHPMSRPRRRPRHGFAPLLQREGDELLLDQGSTVLLAASMALVRSFSTTSRPTLRAASGRPPA